MALTSAELFADRSNNVNSAVKFKVGYGQVPAGVYFIYEPAGFTVMLWIQLLSTMTVNGRICN